MDKGVASISLTIKTGVLVAIMVSVYFSMAAQVDASEKTKNYLQLKDVALYVESKMLQGMETVNVYGSNSTQLLLLPDIGDTVFLRARADSIEVWTPENYTEWLKTDQME